MPAMTTPAASPNSPALVRVSWGRRDRHQGVTYLAAVGASVAAVMAIYGLPGIDLHSPLHRLGIMDPLCGGTRAARYAAQGRVADAWTYNPLGLLTVYGAGVALVRGVIGLAWGRWLNLTMAWPPRRRRWVSSMALLLLAVLEVRQQLRADLLA